VGAGEARWSFSAASDEVALENRSGSLLAVPMENRTGKDMDNNDLRRHRVLPFPNSDHVSAATANSAAFSRPAAGARTRQTGAMPCTGTGTRRQLSASAGALIAVGEAHPDPTVTDHLAAN
jgi:hypothetical protein